MPADEVDVIAQGKQLGLNRVDERVVVAVGKIGPADRAAKQHIANEGEFLGPVVKHDRARRVTGAMENLEGVTGDCDGIAVVEPAVGRDVARAFDAVGRPLLRQTVEQEFIGRMRAFDLDAELGAQFISPAGVIDVAVGQQDFFDCDARLLDGVGNGIEIATGIDDRADFRGFIPDQRAVLLKRRHLDDGGFQRRGWLGGGGLQSRSHVEPIRCR